MKDQTDRVRDAEIGFDDARVGAQGIAAPFKHDRAVLHDIALIGDLERRAGILLDEQDGDMGALQASDDRRRYRAR